MSKWVGFLMVSSGVCLLIALALKLLVQPFITEDSAVHVYFPSTELVLGTPILLGVLFFCGFGFYIVREMLAEDSPFSIK
uniref:Dolichol phosphate-mannose biosynthesis regulatory protein n=1 Tax=Parasteatoda tepidariorum TaxID=114398 RepID=A0A2L2YLZ4_PARTP